MADFGWNEYSAMRNATGPAPKEERMLDPYDPNVSVEELKVEQHETQQRMKRAATLRAVGEKAYFAALSGLMPLATEVDCGIPGLVRDAGMASLETVRQWPAMQAELDALIGEMG